MKKIKHIEGSLNIHKIETAYKAEGFKYLLLTPEQARWLERVDDELKEPLVDIQFLELIDNDKVEPLFAKITCRDCRKSKGLKPGEFMKGGIPKYFLCEDHLED